MNQFRLDISFERQAGDEKQEKPTSKLRGNRSRSRLHMATSRSGSESAPVHLFSSSFLSSLNRSQSEGEGNPAPLEATQVCTAEKPADLDSIAQPPSGHMLLESTSQNVRNIQDPGSDSGDKGTSITEDVDSDISWLCSPNDLRKSLASPVQKPSPVSPIIQSESPALPPVPSAYPFNFTLPSASHSSPPSKLAVSPPTLKSAFDINDSALPTNASGPSTPENVGRTPFLPESEQTQEFSFGILSPLILGSFQSSSPSLVAQQHDAGTASNSPMLNARLNPTKQSEERCSAQSGITVAYNAKVWEQKKWPKELEKQTIMFHRIVSLFARIPPEAVSIIVDLTTILAKDLLQAEQPEGHIYIFKVLKDDFEGFVKVGYTHRGLEERMKEHRKCYGRIEDVYPDKKNRYFVPHVKRVERLIHAELAPYKFTLQSCPKKGKHGTHGEWFRIESDDARKVVEKWVKWMDSDPKRDDGKVGTKTEPRSR